MKVLELFSGTGSIGKICKEKNWEVVSLDLKNADINTDILKWNYKELYKPNDFDIIWASPPCNTFSVLQYALKTRPEIIRNQLENGVPILNKTLEIIDYFKPKYYFIENPDTGMMKNYLTHLPYYTVDYCKYENWGYRKRTRIWTNVTEFIPKICKKDCNSMTDIRNKHLKKVDNTKNMYRIPKNLILDLFNEIKNIKS